MEKTVNVSWLGLEGKVFIVTGGASGIGRAVAEELLSDGAKVAICDMNPQSPVFENATGERVFYLVTDVTSKKSVNQMVSDVVAEFGRIDGIINNAGINWVGLAL